MADLSASIAKAKQAGYSDAEITKYLAADPSFGPKVKTALDAGYGDAEIIGHLTKAAATVAAPKPKRTIVDDVTGAMANFNAGLGIGDEIVAGVKTAGDVVTGKAKLRDVPNAFGAHMGEQRQAEDSFTGAHRNVANLAKGVGMIAPAIVPGASEANAFASGSRIANMARGAVSAATGAAGYAAADRGTFGERLGAASDAATNPAVLALGAAGGAFAARAKPKAEKVPAPSIDELRAQKNAAYGAVDKSGVTYDPKAFDGFVDDTAKAMADANISAIRHPKAASMLQDLQGMKGQSPSLTQMDQLRQVIRRDVAGSNDPAEQFFGQKMIEQLDGFIDNAGGEGSDLVRNARDLNTRVRKIDTINETVEEAKHRAGSTGSGGNVDNATRQNLRRVMEKTKNFTPEERAALEQIVMGSPGQNALRQVGKLSPQGNGLMTALSIGGTMANPLLGIPTAAGAVSKVAADAITQKRVVKLVELIAAGKGGAAEAAAQRELAEIVANLPKANAFRAQAAATASNAAGVEAENAFRPPREINVNRSTNPDHLRWRAEQGLP